MAKIVKDTRETMDVNAELESIKKSNDKKNTSSKKKDKKDTKKKSNKTSSKKNFKFLKEVRSEVAKVKWPSKKDMIKYSVATISFIIFFALFFYLIDIIIALLKAGV